MKLRDRYDVSIGLSVVPAGSGAFCTPILLGDFPEVPRDLRVLSVGPTTYSDIATTAAASAWLAAMWAQNKGGPTSAYIGRWVSADVAPEFVMWNPGTTIATWAAATTSLDFAITDGTTTEEFAAALVPTAEDMDDVCTSLQTEVRTSTSFASDLSAATVTWDSNLGRITLTTAATGAGEQTYTIIAPTGGSGTDITGTSFLNVSDGYTVAGADAEDPDDALAACMQEDDTPFLVGLIGGTAAQKYALGVACASYRKFYIVRMTDSAVKSSASTTDEAYLLGTAGVNDAYGVYTAHTTQYPDAAVCGGPMVLPEGTGNTAGHGLVGCYESKANSDGSEGVLTSTEIAALRAKSADFVVKIGSKRYCSDGLTFGGAQVHTRVGLRWAELRAMEEMSAFISNRVETGQLVTFSDPDILAIVSIIERYIKILQDRKCVDSYTLSIPSAADISLVVKATRRLTLSEVAAILASYAVNFVTATATATV